MMTDKALSPRPSVFSDVFLANTSSGFVKFDCFVYFDCFFYFE